MMTHPPKAEPPQSIPDRAAERAFRALMRDVTDHVTDPSGPDEILLRHRALVEPAELRRFIRAARALYVYVWERHQ